MLFLTAVRGAIFREAAAERAMAPFTHDDLSLSGTTPPKHRHDGRGCQAANDNRPELRRIPIDWRQYIQLVAISALLRAAWPPADTSSGLQRVRVMAPRLFPAQVGR
jgi:hypothetical protein